MINQVVANPDYTSTSNQYGFYAIPKTVKPKPKYREDNDEEEDEDEPVGGTIVPLQDHPEDERKLERDYYVNEAPWPQYREKQPGLNYGVQVEDQDLFDFQREVEPLLQILVGQSLVKAQNELQEETEKVDHEKKLSDFNKKRNAELMVTQRLEAQRKRKTEEAERRVLQHKVHKDQKKALLKKVISHRESKRALMGLRNEVLGDLEQEGLLRSDPYLNLRTHFEPWLYEQIIDCLQEQDETKRTVNSICGDKQKDLANKHSEHIKKQNQRRKDILDQRERERLAEQDRKRKRAIKKHRKALNTVRTQRQGKVWGVVSKGDKIDSVAKAEISDGQARPKPVAYVSGGVVVHIAEVLQVLSELGVNLTDEQTEDLVVRVLGELAVPTDVPLSKQVEATIRSLEASMRENFPQFHKRRPELIEQAATNDMLGGQWRRITGTKIRPAVLKAISKAILNVYLSQAVPQEKPAAPKEPVEGEPGEPAEPQPAEPAAEQIVLTQRQNQRLAVRSNINLQFEQPLSFAVPSEIVRVRVPLQHPQEQQQHPADPEYIEIFDGEGWRRTLQKYPQRHNPSESEPRSYTFSGFDRTFIYDEISNYHFEQWLVSLLHKQGVQVPEQFSSAMSKYNSTIEHFGEHLSKDDSIAVFDFEAEE